MVDRLSILIDESKHMLQEESEGNLVAKLRTSSFKSVCVYKRILIILK
jgi:hypothetical protein